MDWTDHMTNWNGHMTTGGWAFSILGMLIVLALVAAMVVWIARELRDRRPASATPTSAREILDRRLASGEIKTEQYEQLRRKLAVPDVSP